MHKGVFLFQLFLYAYCRPTTKRYRILGRPSMIFTRLSNRGFTLIELLVVIAIIGILSSIVLSSLNDARNKAGNAAVKSNLANIRVQAALYYDSNNTYGSYAFSPCPISGTGSVFHDPNILDAISSAKTAGGDTTNLNRCFANASGWAVSVPLKKKEGLFGHWCVDANGASMGRASAITIASCQ